MAKLTEEEVLEMIDKASRIYVEVGGVYFGVEKVVARHAVEMIVGRGLTVEFGRSKSTCFNLCIEPPR